MGRLILVRHGQTTGAWYDRDRLSERGERQATRLGESWAAAGRRLDTVYVGPRQRHRQTCDAVAAAYRARSLAFPEPVELPELDEYAAEPLLQVLLPRLAERDATVRELLAAGPLEGPDGERRLFRLLEPLGRAWVRGELEAPEVERWSAFVARVGTALGRMTRGTGKGAEVAAFTSAGPVSVSVGLALGAEGERVFAHSLSVRNTSCTEFLFSSERISLQTFNDTAHLPEAELQTLR